MTTPKTTTKTTAAAVVVAQDGVETISVAKQAQKTPLAAAPPPWHTVATVGALLAVFSYLFPSWDEIDQVAKVEHFTTVVFADWINLKTVAVIRTAIAVSIWTLSFYLVFIDQGWDQFTSYLPASKLISVPNRLSGYKAMLPFTSWSWNLLGLSFSCNAYIAWHQVAKITNGNNNDNNNNNDEDDVNIWVLRAAVILFDIAAPFTLLVAAVIRYAIWPAVLRKTGMTAGLKSFRNVMMHNVNVLFALSEVALMSGLKVHPRHFAFGTIVGCFYVIFSWSAVHLWNKPEHGPQFIYFFFDTTLPGFFPTMAILVLLAVLATFYGIFCVCDVILAALGSGLIAHVSFVVVVCSLVMRFRD